MQKILELEGLKAWITDKTPKLDLTSSTFENFKLFQCKAEQ